MVFSNIFRLRCFNSAPTELASSQSVCETFVLCYSPKKSIIFGERSISSSPLLLLTCSKVNLYLLIVLGMGVRVPIRVQIEAVQIGGYLEIWGVSILKSETRSGIFTYRIGFGYYPFGFGYFQAGSDILILKKNQFLHH